MYVHFYSAIAKYEQMIIVSSIFSMYVKFYTANSGKMHSKVAGTGYSLNMDPRTRGTGRGGSRGERNILNQSLKRERGIGRRGRGGGDRKS